MLLLCMSDIWICMFILLQNWLIMKTVCNDINMFTIVTRLCGWWDPAADDGGVICCNSFVPTKLLDFTVPSCSFRWASLSHSAAVFFLALLALSYSFCHRTSLVSHFPAVSVACSSAVLALYYSPHRASLVFHSSAVSLALARHSPNNNG